MGIKERIIDFINSKGMPIKQFEEKCNLSNGYISSMRKGFGTGKLENVLNAFPELNRNWLLYGEGTMLNSEDSNILPSIEKKRLIEIGSEVFEKKLNELFQSGIIVPASVVMGKDAKINELYREIGKLEAKIEELESKKDNAQMDDNAECAVAK